MAGPEAGLGCQERAEKLNGRMAVLGFVAALASERITSQGLTHTDNRDFDLLTLLSNTGDPHDRVSDWPARLARTRQAWVACTSVSGAIASM